MDNGASSYRRFLEGDESAFDDVIKELYSGLVFFIEGYVHDIHAAEDIAMDAFADLIVHRHRYNFKVSLKTYLYTIGRSRALDSIRRKKLVSLVGIEEAEALPSVEDIPEDSLVADERKKAVHSAISRLPKDMRAAVHLVYFEGMTYSDAAKILKKTPKQVDNLLFRAKKELRVILGKAGELFI